MKTHTASDCKQFAEREAEEQRYMFQCFSAHKDMYHLITISIVLKVSEPITCQMVLA
jgi:hypothetical protein